MAGILDLLGSANNNQQLMMDILSGKFIPRRSNDPMLMRNATPPALAAPRAGQDAVADMDASSARDPSIALAPMILAMQNEQAQNQSQGSYYDPDTAQALLQAQIDPRNIPSNPDPFARTYNRTATDFQNAKAAAESAKPDYGFADALIDAGRGLMIAGSPDPAKAAAGFADSWANERAGRKPKVTPLADGAFSMVTYPNGKTEIVKNDQIANYLGDRELLKFQQALQKTILSGQIAGQNATNRIVTAEQARNAGDATQTGLSVTELTSIADSLENTDTATGPAIGLLPKWARDIVTPGGADLQDRAERIIQASLRATLGAQFTEKEGARFLERSYNPRLDEKTNAARLRQIAKELSDIQADKEGALEYMKKNKTLEGFVPKAAQPTANQPAPASAPASAPAPAPAAASGGPTRITSEAEWANLPSGTQYIGPDGKTRTKR